MTDEANDELGEGLVCDGCDEEVDELCAECDLCIECCECEEGFAVEEDMDDDGIGERDDERDDDGLA